MQPILYISGNRIDLFDDEGISINSAIINLSDITKIRTDFSRTFTVPASSNNNKIFKHYYNANIDNTFDARKKVDGLIELGGIPFKFGKWTLQKVSVKEGKAKAYTVNFTGNLIDLSKKLGKDELKDVDLSSYDHDFNGEVVKTGLTSSLFNGAVKYIPLVGKQLFYNSDNTDNTNTDELVNIAENGNSDVRGIDFSELKPSINNLSLIEAIENQYNLQFSRDFFGENRFKNSYLYCSNSTEKPEVSRELIEFDNGSERFWNPATNEFNIYAEDTEFSVLKIDITVFPASGFENTPYDIIINLDGTDVKTRGINTGQRGISYSFKPSLETKTALFYIKTNEPFECNVVVDISDNVFFDSTSYVTNSIGFTVTPVLSIQDNMPELQIIDYLKAIFDSFRLIAIPMDDGSIYVESLDNYYRLGKFIDVTRYIDFDSYDVERGDLLNEINFSFEEPSTILGEQFEKNNKLPYGDESVKLTDENGELLDGDSLDVDIPFEQVVYERLNDLKDGTETNFGYGALIDLNRSKSTPKALFHYAIRNSLGSKPVKFIGTNDEVSVLEVMNIPSHSIDLSDEVTQPFSFLFSSEISYYTRALLDVNLYTECHRKYIEGIFNIKRRDFKFKARLNQSLISKISLNDILKIDNNYYRINSYESDLTTGETDLNLFNAYDSNLIGVADENYTISNDGDSVFYPATVSSIVNIDSGFGTDWFSAVYINNKIVVTMSPNSVGFLRFGEIQVTSDSGKVTKIEIQQSPISITADNNDITSDNNIITADNNI